MKRKLDIIMSNEIFFCLCKGRNVHAVDGYIQAIDGAERVRRFVGRLGGSGQNDVVGADEDIVSMVVSGNRIATCFV
jgi:hypothetical protein